MCLFVVLHSKVNLLQNSVDVSICKPMFIGGVVRQCFCMFMCVHVELQSNVSMIVL